MVLRGFRVGGTSRQTHLACPEVNITRHLGVEQAVGVQEESPGEFLVDGLIRRLQRHRARGLQGDNALRYRAAAYARSAGDGHHLAVGEKARHVTIMGRQGGEVLTIVPGDIAQSGTSRAGADGDVDLR